MSMFTQKTLIFQTEVFPSLTIVVNVVRNYCNSNNKNKMTDHNSSHEFEYPFDRFGSAPSPESETTVSDMLSAVETPFLLENNLYWRNPRRPNSLITPPLSLNDIVREISEVACNMVWINGSGRTSLSMLVTIQNRVIVPLQLFQSLREQRKQEEVLEGRRNMVLRIMEHERRRTGTSLLSETTLRSFVQVQLGELERALIEEAVMMRVAPAAKESVEALEKFRYDGVSSKVEVMMCTICMEGVLTGNQLTRMPCSHVFHGHCILEWLQSRHSCPICRFKLPIEN